MEAPPEDDADKFLREFSVARAWRAAGEGEDGVPPAPSSDEEEVEAQEAFEASLVSCCMLARFLTSSANIVGEWLSQCGVFCAQSGTRAICDELGVIVRVMMV